MGLELQHPVRSEHIALRPLVLADADALHAYRSIPEMCLYVPFEPMDLKVISDRLANRWSRATLQQAGEALLLGAELVETGELVGDVMLAWTSEEHRSGEVGYMWNPAFGGRGYATEAVHSVLHLAFEGLGLHRVIARIDARNGPSARLAARLGMRQEAHLRENEWFKGEWSDELDFAMLEDEWRAQHREGVRPCTLQG